MRESPVGAFNALAMLPAGRSMMLKTKLRYFGMWFVALIALMFPASEAFARGGRGRGGGGRGRGGRGGAAGRAARAAARGRNNRSGKRDEEEKEARREERMGRVALARLAYAKRERQRDWDAETSDRFSRMLARILGGSSD